MYTYSPQFGSNWEIDLRHLVDFEAIHLEVHILKGTRVIADVSIATCARGG